MDDKTRKDGTQEGLDRLEDLEVAELSDDDLESVAGGVDEIVAGDCNSIWCCSNNNG